MYTEINSKYRLYISNWLILMFFLVSSMIIVGGLTRLTDSGLSITKWEFFKGFFPPLNNETWNAYFDSYKKIPEFKLQNFSMTLSEFKFIFWWEWAHRFFGRIIGLTFLIPLIFFSIKVGFKKLSNLHLIFLLICFQGFLGWYMVKSGLVNDIDVSHFRLSIHLLFAFIILSLIFWNYLDLIYLKEKERKMRNYLPEIFMILIFLQIIFGAFVSGMDAGKIYNSWPLMGDSFFPDDNKIINLFKFSAFSDPSLVQYLHRNMAYLIFVLYIIIAFTVYKNKILPLFKPILILGLVVFLQIILGILTLLSGAGILISSLHQFSSILLITASLYFLYKNKFSF
ncbi:COX15/CtaA family protein [Candidatus Pelagibacter sp.]|nr:COX15/CtaA family protein [Candidatus Pelagibacter sp.]